MTGVQGGRPRKSVQAKKEAGSYNATRDIGRTEVNIIGEGELKPKIDTAWDYRDRNLALGIYKHLSDNKMGSEMHHKPIAEYINLTGKYDRISKLIVGVISDLEKGVAADKKLGVIIQLKSLISSLSEVRKVMHGREQQFGLTPLDATRIVNGRHLPTDKDNAMIEVGKMNAV